VNQSNQGVFEELRHRLLNDALLWISITGTPSVIISVVRVFTLNLSLALAAGQILILATLWLTYFFRNLLPYLARVFILLATLWIVMALGLSKLGPVANASIYTILSAFIAILFLRALYATWVIVTNILTVSIIAYAAHRHWISFDVDYSVYAHNPLVWVLTIWGLAAYSIIFALIGLRMIQGLLASESKFHQLFDTTTDAIILLNPHKILDCNKAALSMFGIKSVEEFCTFQLSDLSPSTQDNVTHTHTLEAEHIRTAMNNGSDQFEWEYRRNDTGATFPAEVLLSAMTLKGAPVLQATVRDITERKHIEKMKSEFVSTVSHELRTPLTSISGALGLINGGALGEMPVQSKQMLDIAYKNSLRLTHLINDLLDMEKLVAGKMSFDMQILNLKPQLEQALNAIRDYSAERNIKYILTISNEFSSNDLTVKADESRLQQVLSNFLSNAAKFSPDAGQVEIRLQKINGMARVEVIDHGPGIPVEFYPSIFQKFSQADSSDSRQKGGTGLGLAISKEIIERMQGKVGFNSQTGRSTCFYFDLPCLQPDV